jgi:hypothetical protein
LPSIEVDEQNADFIQNDDSMQDHTLLIEKNSKTKQIQHLEEHFHSAINESAARKQLSRAALDTETVYDEKDICIQFIHQLESRLAVVSAECVDWKLRYLTLENSARAGRSRTHAGEPGAIDSLS